MYLYFKIDSILMSEKGESKNNMKLNNNKDKKSTNEIARFYPTYWEKYNKKGIIITISFSFFLIILLFYSYKNLDNFISLLTLFLTSGFIILSITAISYSNNEPLILYNHGILPQKTKLSSRITGREIINFDQIYEIKHLDTGEWIRFKIILKNKKGILQICNTANEFFQIKNTFKNYNN